METDYLKSCFGNCLAQALADVAKVRPSDPIEYLAYWLRHYRKTALAAEEAQFPVALSTRKMTVMQESSEPPEKEALGQEALPGTAVPGSPRQSPPLQSDCLELQNATGKNSAGGLSK